MEDRGGLFSVRRGAETVLCTGLGGGPVGFMSLVGRAGRGGGGFDGSFAGGCAGGGLLRAADTGVLWTPSESTKFPDTPGSASPAHM